MRTKGGQGCLFLRHGVIKTARPRVLAGIPAATWSRRPEICFSRFVNVSQTIAIAAVVLAGLCAPGCSKHAGTPPVDPSAAAGTNALTSDTNAVPGGTNAAEIPATANSRTRDLGVLQFTNHCETQIQLDAGKSCTITPVLIDRQHVQLTMVLETKMADGKTQGLKITKVVAKIDQQFEVNFGGLDLTLTPQMAPE